MRLLLALLACSLAFAQPEIGRPVGGNAPSPSATLRGGVKTITCSGTDKVSSLATDGTFTCTVDQSGGGSSHEILSVTHTDTTAATVLRGALMVGQQVTPKWELLGLGTVKKSLFSDGTDLLYQYVRLRSHATDCTSLTDGLEGEACYEQDADTIYICEPTAGGCDTAAEWRQTGGAGGNHNLLSTTHSDTTAASPPTRGDIITGQGATTTWTRLGKGTQYQVLLGGSLEPGWGAVDLTQSTAITGVLGSANGGTGNGFTKFTGPATAEKTFTLPDVTATILTTNAAVTVGQGGTGATTLTGILQGNGTSTFTAVTDSSTVGQVLRVTGASTYAWGALDLADADAITGILPGGNGGTGNAFFAVSGPATPLKTFTFPNASATVLTTNDAVTVGQGGTGIASGTSGGVPYFSATTTIASSAALTASTIVLGGGAGAAPTTGAGYTVVTAGSAGTAANNAGTATTLARSDHEHRDPWQVGIFFESTPATGEFPLPLPANNQCGADMDVSSVSITALVKGTTFTFNLGRYTTAGASVGNLWASAQTYNTGGNNRQDFTPGQNADNITNTDFFRVNIVSITGTDDFAVTVQGRCKNVN